MMRHMAKAEVVGVHEVEADEPCHLVELRLDGLTGPLDLAAFTQSAAGLDSSSWQVPWQEALLDSAGETLLAGPWLSDADAESWNGNVRLAFFFHYLDLTRDLQTPLGPLRLPAPSISPARLGQLRYARP